eukprot:3268788-Alexandrium_andersonii.AAC.1
MAQRRPPRVGASLLPQLDPAVAACELSAVAQRRSAISSHCECQPGEQGFTLRQHSSSTS